MTLLHDFFFYRNKQAFQRLLDSSTDKGQASTSPSTSGGKSRNRPGVWTSVGCDINARDWLGRTVLHLACASLDGVEYVRLLLRHQAINVNIPDEESHWTALHRALYHSNFPAALLLLQRVDTDRSLQDLEGYTAFELYNTTLSGTKPGTGEHHQLYTWGVNRNAALGLGDGSDRLHPDQVIIPRKDELVNNLGSLSTRFSPIYVRQIRMSKLHTAVLTSEGFANLRLCGFGSGGRLGSGQHTQYNLRALPQVTHNIISVALGQDHTLALTNSGDVLSWGLNRFGQLGYVVESSATGEGFTRAEEPIQATPRKIYGALRKQVVIGVAASKMASACWTREDIYTWGTNNGQLGYDKSPQPVQISPRKVTKVTQPVIEIALTDFAMVCLLDTLDVVCIWNDRHIKISFPGNAFPSAMRPYRPPQAIQDAKIAKITSCEDTFAALSSNGELFTFSVSNPADHDGLTMKDRTSFKPQRVWALRKKFSAVRDVALGSDGTMIVCTESGHVFVRSRNSKTGQVTASKAFKFQRIPYLQRVTQVCANSTGAFGALRLDHKPSPIEVCGNTIAQDLAEIQPFLWPYQRKLEPPRAISTKSRFPIVDEDADDDIDIEHDIQQLSRLFGVLDMTKNARGESDPLRLPYGANVVVHGSGNVSFPVHGVILAARSSVLRAILNGTTAIKHKGSGISFSLFPQPAVMTTVAPVKLVCRGCHPVSILLLLNFLYSDEVATLWDIRISIALSEQVRKFQANPTQIRDELRSLATILELPHLSRALESPVKHVPIPSMALSMAHLFQNSQDFILTDPKWPGLSPDVILQLADKDIICHSVILRARSPFFSDFFSEEDWTSKRWNSDGMVVVDMKHLSWNVMEYVLRFMCCGADAEMFDTMDFANSADDVLEFTFDVMAAANELLLDRLVLLCSTVILDHMNFHNACFILAEATYLHCEQLMERLHSYIITNMELFLMTGTLDDISSHLVKDLSRSARQRQREKSPISRSGLLALKAVETHAEWLSLQDIPQPIARSNVPSRKDSPNVKTLLSRPPVQLTRADFAFTHNPSTPPHNVIRQTQSTDDIFAMDDADMPPVTTPSTLTPLARSRPPTMWKAPSTPRVDMKAVIAEAEANASSPQWQPTKTNSEPSGNTPKGTTSLVQPDLKGRPQIINKTMGAGGPLKIVPEVVPSWRIIQEGSISTTPDSMLKQNANNLSTASQAHFPSLGAAASIQNVASQTAPRASSSLPGLGPVITPTRQLASSSNTYAPTMRRASGKAWNKSLTKPVATIPDTTSGMSFAAIQQLELDQMADNVKDKRSLREIQEEEKSLREEAEFLVWWTAEEARVKAEEDAAVAAVSTATGPNRSKQKKRSGERKKTDQAELSPGKVDHTKYHARKPARKEKL